MPRRVKYTLLDCITESDEVYSCSADYTLQQNETSKHIRDRLRFPGPLMSAKLQKDQLMSYIQAKRQECSHDLDKDDQQKTYFFWSIMELCCHRNGRVMMAEIATVLFREYSFIRRKLGRVMSKEDWCLPLAQLLCSNAPEDELRKKIIQMGDEYGLREWTYAAQICYVAAQLNLGLREEFMLIGCFSDPEDDSFFLEAIERTEVYEYILSLTSGFGQRSFQTFKIDYCNMLAKHEDVVRIIDYCQIIAAELLRFPQCRKLEMVQQVIKLIDFALMDKQEEEEPECVKDLYDLLAKDESEFHPSDHPEFDLRYTMGEKLGEGGYGSVFAGVRKSDGKEVAIKCIAKDFQYGDIGIPGETDNLPLEVALLQMASKPPHCDKVIQMLEWFETPVFVIMVMERPKPCMDLYNFWAYCKFNMTEPMVQKIMLQVVEGVKHCCDRGVLHRDIKPENILIHPKTLRIKLIDFGCDDLLKDKCYTFFKGTPGYSPPEWIMHRKYRAVPATVWSLGVLQFTLACGDYPFDSDEEIVDGHLKFTSGISKECADLIRRCLAHDPKCRPSLEELLDCEWLKQGRSTQKS